MQEQRSTARRGRKTDPSLPEPKAEAQKPGNGGPSASSFIPLTTLQSSPAHPDLDAVRARLEGKQGPKYWRSLEELADSDAFRQYLEREFPHQAPRDWAPLGRREFFRLMGATLALAGVGGCSYQPPEKIVPYVEQPEELVPGKPLYYTTAFQRSGYAYGLLAESQMGRPVKLEGNPEHPASLGATDAMGQASLLGLYDPDRSQAVRNLGDLSTWEEFLGWMTDQAVDLHRKRGAGLRVLTETVTSPTLAAQLQRLLAVYPEARLTQHEPVGRENVREGARQAFGEEVNPVYHFDRAERILSLDSDFLTEEPGSLRYARDFSDGRRLRAGRTQMNRLYVVESTHSLTGANADHRLALRPSLIEGVARAVAGALGAGGGQTAAPQGVPPGWIDALVKDLQSHRGASLVVAGMRQPPVVHALAHAMNQALGNIGKTVTFTAPVEVHFGAREGTLAELVTEMQGGRVDTLVILGANPVYTAPADLKFGDALQKVAQRVHLGLYDDETAVQCQWHIPESHYLEAWSDARAYDGTTSIVQPLIVPLYTTRSAHELLAALVGDGDRNGYDVVREHWIGQNPRYVAPAGKGAAATVAGSAAQTVPPTVPTASAEFEQFWRRALVAGTIPGTQAPAKTVTGRPNITSASSAAASGSGMEIVFAPDPGIWDGRFANNGWLQEVPKPLTQLTWDNAVLISPATARAHQVDYRDRVRLSLNGRTLDAAVWILPGQPEEVVTLYLGHGRTRSGRVGTGTGFNAYALRGSEAPWFAGGLEINKIGGNYRFATAQRFFTTHGRDLVRVGTLEELAANPTAPEFMKAHEEETPGSLYGKKWPSDGEEPGHPAAAPAPSGAESKEPPTYDARGYNDQPIPAWGMVIDVNTCIGCNACVVACQAENNIATVGKAEVARHRQMHWIRIDTYYSGSPESPDTAFEPIPCMHCENAPCEPVCPVEATSHSAEGINEQTYNRCIGTRYCQNNCPYKVRVFNYLQFSDQKTPTIQMMRNPDVTVRSRGVMEKCTYCVQRVNEARIQAEKEDRELKDGDVLTACQQVCPTRAITFGNINDTKGQNGQGSLVRQLKREPLNYALLTELNTRPRTSYLAKVRNPNPDLKI